MTANVARIFIGYDSKEVAAYHVLAHTLIETSSMPVMIAPLALNQLAGVFTRERNALQSTEFSFSRFLVPYLSNFEGWSLFMDCDMIALEDIANLWALRDDEYAVMCCQHDYTPKEDVKFLGQVQTKYEKKNWSSVMLFNNAKCRALTPDYVNTATGLQLHQFKWLENDNLIGSLPLKWNHLVGVYDHNPDAGIVHYTEGGPYFDDYKDVDYSVEWFAAKERMLTVAQRQAAAAVGSAA
jgi:lipopolysaccharide biosynthesis glycosyltransferase